MPYPHPASAAVALDSPLFGDLRHRARRCPEIFPLHVGDCWNGPPEGAWAEGLEPRAWHHRYLDPAGWPPLREALLEKVRQVNALPVAPDGLLVTAGATGALSAVAGALLDPGDEVIVLTACWPLVRGIVAARLARPVEVPFTDRAHDPDAVREVLEAAVGPRTVAVYVNTPNNPTGVVVGERVQAVIADFARRHGLWIWSDEVYEHHAWRAPHRSIGRLAPERTLTAFSFSKSYAMSGDRIGYLVGPPEVVAAARRLATHAIYNPTTASQVAALGALGRGAAWLAQARESFRSEGDQAAAALGVNPPEGGTFLFLDVARHLDHRGLAGLLEDAADRGLLLAPGPSFGPFFPTHVRLCFTCEPPEVTRRGVAVLADLLGGASPLPPPGDTP